MIYHLVLQTTLLFLVNLTLTVARPDATITATATTTDHFISPTVNAVASAGLTFPIEWIVTTDSDPSSYGEDYTLTLFMDGKKIRILDSEANSTAGDNTFVWVPGTSLVDSTEYHVRVIYSNFTLISPKFAVTGGQQSTTTMTSSQTGMPTSTLASSPSSSSAASSSSSFSTSNPNTNTATRTKRRSHTGAIVGGIVGGLLGLACLVGLIWVFCLSKRRKDKVSKSRLGDDNHYEESAGGVNGLYTPELHAESKEARSELPVDERPIGELSGGGERAELMGSDGGRGLRTELP